MDSAYPRQNAWIFHAGDTWRVNDKLTLDYGLRWDYYSPSSEKYDRFSFFDPVGANPGAGGRPGRLAFAGDSYGAASYGARYPEEDLYGGFAPRLGAVYRSTRRRCSAAAGASSTRRRSIRAGAAASRRTASRTRPRSPARSAASSRRSSSSRACRRTSRGRPTSASDYRNGQGILYRPLDANERPYSHQWNITVDRELGRNLSLSVAYVGSAGRRLPSSIEPLNAIDPTYLSMGDALNDEFTAGHDQPRRRAAAVSGLGRADDRLRAVGRAGAAALTRSTATTCRA